MGNFEVTRGLVGLEGQVGLVRNGELVRTWDL